MARQPRGLVILTEGILSVFCFEGVYMDGSIGGLSGDILVQRIPGDALYVVAVFGYLSNEGSCVGVVDTGNIVHTANDEMGGVRRPGQVVYFSSARATHVLGPPRLLVILGVGSEAGRGELAGNPEDHVAVVAGGGKDLALGCPSHDIDGLVVLGEGREVLDFAVRAVRVDFPDANVVVTAGGS